MDDAPFTNREIKQYFDNFNQTLLRLEDTLERRVTPLEEEFAKLLLWREGLMGKIAVIVLIAAAIWGLIVAFITKRFF